MSDPVIDFVLSFMIGMGAAAFAVSIAVFLYMVFRK